MTNIFSNLLSSSAQDVGAQAAQSALDTAAARPFNVVMSIDDTTKSWITTIIILGGIFAMIKGAKK